MAQRSSLNFQMPGFVQPKTYEAIERIPQTFDEIFNRITRARALERAQARQKKLDDMAEVLGEAKLDAQYGPGAGALMLGMEKEKRQQAFQRALLPPSAEQGMAQFPGRMDFAEQQAAGLDAGVDPGVSALEEQLRRSRGLMEQQRSQQGAPSSLEALVARDIASGKMDLDTGIQKLAAIRQAKRTPKSTVDLKPGEMFVPGKSPEDVPPEQVRVQPIPGSLAEFEMRKAKSEERERGLAEKKRLLTLRQDTKDIIRDIDEIKNQANSWTVGLVGSKLTGVNPEARDLQENLKSLFAKIAFGRLQKMREESKTGGALGQVSNIELGLLGNSKNSLEQSQSPAQFKRNLDRVLFHYKRYLSLLEPANSVNGRYKQLRESGFDAKDATSVLKDDGLISQESGSPKERVEELESLGLSEDAAHEIAAAEGF